MLALYISLLDTEEQISKIRTYLQKNIVVSCSILPKVSCKILIWQKMLSMKTFLDRIRIIDSIRANNEKELSQF